MTASDRITTPVASRDERQLDLAPIKARATDAAPGPWAVSDPNEGSSHAPLWSVANRAYFNEDTDEAVGIIVEYGGREDADFIAHAREDIPALIAEVERLRRELNGRDKLLRAAFEAGDDAMVVIARDESWHRWAR